MVLLLVLFLDLGWAEKPVTLDVTAAKAALVAKEYEKVVEIVSPHLDIANRDAYLTLVRAYVAQGNSALAQKTLTTGRSKFPQDPEFPTELGRVYLSLNKDREAKAVLKEVIDANPKYEPAYLAMAEMYEKRKNKYELRLLYQDLLERVGLKAEYLTRLCDLSTQEGHYDLAFKYCKDGIRIMPREPLNYINLAGAYKETGNMAEAEGNYKKAADSFSKSELAQFSYAQFLDEQKRPVDSYKYYKRASEADGKSVRSWLGLGFSSLEIQKYQDSLNAFQKVCENDRNGIKHVRKAAGQMKPLNLPQWMKKYEELIQHCEGLTPGKRFL